MVRVSTSSSSSSLSAGASGHTPQPRLSVSAAGSNPAGKSRQRGSWGAGGAAVLPVAAVRTMANVPPVAAAAARSGQRPVLLGGKLQSSTAATAAKGEPSASPPLLSVKHTHQQKGVGAAPPAAPPPLRPLPKPTANAATANAATARASPLPLPPSLNFPHKPPPATLSKSTQRRQLRRNSWRQRWRQLW